MSVSLGFVDNIESRLESFIKEYARYITGCG